MLLPPSGRLSADDIELALAHIRLGVRLTWALAACGVAYALLTPGEPHRVVLAVLFVVAMGVGTIVSRLSLRPVLASRWHEVFFVAWSSSYFMLITVACLLDDGVRSPMASLFVVPLVFAALAYQEASMRAVAAMSLVSYALVAALTAGDDLGRTLYLGAVLAATGALCVDYSRRQAAQRAALIASEARYRGIIETANEGVWILDAKGRTTFVNDTLAAMLGHAPEDMAGHPPEAFATTRMPIADDAGSIDVELRRADGTTFWAMASLARLRLADDAQLVMVADITARKQAEAAREQRASEREVIAHLGRRALEVDLATLLREACGTVAERLRAPGAGVYELQPDGDGHLLVAGTGYAPGSIGRPRQPEGVTVALGGDREPYGVLAVRTDEAGVDDLAFLDAVAHLLSTVLERADAEQRLRHQALHDPLTDLPNRRCFLERLTELLAGERRQDIAVLLLDLDEFKLVNDSLGHALGDELLRTMAGRLAEAVRSGDLIARLGGDEFVVLCERVEGAGAAEILAGRLADAWERPFHVGGTQLYASASIGIAVATPRRDASAEQLLREADAAMYRAKERGSGWATFHEDMQTMALNHLRIEGELRGALDHHELRLAYQPIVRIEDGRVEGVEALLRWEHPERGLLLPGEFLEIAERTGLIVPIGRWVLGEACRQVATWNAAANGDPLQLTVNVSPRQIAAGTLAVDVAEALERSGLDARLLGLEITEHTLIENAEEAGRVLDRLHERGVRVLLDDFGTGYSSLGYMRRFRIDGVKIDRLFVAGVHEDPGQRAIVQAIVRMASSLGLDVVAEGVEQEDQRQELRRLGGEHAQGYLFSKPLPPAELEQLLAAAASRL